MVRNRFDVIITKVQNLLVYFAWNERTRCIDNFSWAYLSPRIRSCRLVLGSSSWSCENNMSTLGTGASICLLSISIEMNRMNGKKRHRIRINKYPVKCGDCRMQNMFAESNRNACFAAWTRGGLEIFFLYRFYSILSIPGLLAVHFGFFYFLFVAWIFLVFLPLLSTPTLILSGC